MMEGSSGFCKDRYDIREEKRKGMMGIAGFICDDHCGVDNFDCCQGDGVGR